MSIQELTPKFKGAFTNTDILLALLIIAVALISFVLGRISVTGEIATVPLTATVNESLTSEPRIEVTPVISTETAVAAEETKTPQAQSANAGNYVGSKNGTKYHLPWCGSAKQIKEENKVWFQTKEEAEAKGYTPASNCKGI